MSDGEAGGDRSLEALVDRAELDVLEFLRALIVDEDPEEAEHALEDLERVAVEAEELLETVAVSELHEAVDHGELPDVVDLESVPEAVASGDLGEAIESQELLDVVHLGELWAKVNVREFWRNKGEFETAVEEAFGDDVGEDESRLDRLQSSFAEAMDDAGVDMDAVEDEVRGDDADASIPGGTNTDALQTAVQSGLRDAVDEFRASILEARESLVERREALAARTEGVGQPNSRNPTAFSTMVGSRTGPPRGTSGHSTVPAETRYSAAPNRKRIYGDRFEDAEEGDDA
jgi:hypothetical protein